MKAIIRISGKVGINTDIKNTLYRLRLRKKYACVVLQDSKELDGMISKVRDFVAFGNINKETLKELIIKRGRMPGDKAIKTDAEKIVEELTKGKSLGDLNLKPFFRLHPARGGIVTKQHYPKGVLGDNKEDINKLLRRML